MTTKAKAGQSQFTGNLNTTATGNIFNLLEVNNRTLSIMEVTSFSRDK